MNEQLKPIELLKSPDFPHFLEQFELPMSLYHELFSAHILCIGAYSSGIKEGGINLHYKTILSSHEEDDILDIPFFEPTYHFYTRRYSLIEDSTHCANNSQKIHHLNHEFGNYRDPRSFRDFLNKYIKKHRVYDYNKEHQKNITSYSFSIKFQCSTNIKNREQELYSQLIETQPNIEAFFNWYRYSNILKEKDFTQKKKKI